MSVAFRRESDEEHKEPRFEIPLPAGANLVTLRGLGMIEARVTELELLVVSERDEARLEDVRRDLRYWRTRLATAELQPPAAGDVVAFGTQVTFRLNGRERSVAIVGDDEADPASGTIAFSAPLARAMMNTEAGDFAGFNGDEDAIEILSIAPVS